MLKTHKSRCTLECSTGETLSIAKAALTAAPGAVMTKTTELIEARVREEVAQTPN